MCRSGSAADTQNLSAYVQYFLHQHSLELDTLVSVKTAARLATQLTYQNKVGTVLLRGTRFFLQDTSVSGQVRNCPVL